MALVLAALVCLCSGAALVTAAWPRGLSSAAVTGMKLSLSIGFGVGIFSVVFFFCRVLGIANLFAADLIVLLILAVLRLLVRGRVNAISSSAADHNLLPRWLWNIVIAAFSISICAAIYNAIVRALAYPQGEGWDAFAIWNLHARFLFRGVSRWRDGFSALIPWSHPDYPLLLPAAIAHFWSYVGHETTLASVILGLLFTFSTVGLLFSSLAILQGKQVATLGTLALIVTPFFIEQGTSQYADVPLAFFFLATIVLVSLSNAVKEGATSLLGLAGMAAGWAAWTKNEGLLLLCAMLLAWLIVLTLRGSQGIAMHNSAPHLEATPSGGGVSKRFWILLVGTLPALLLIVWFKHSIAPRGDLLTDSRTVLTKLATPARYWAISRWYAKEIVLFGRWLLLPGTVLVGGLFSLGVRETAPLEDVGFRVCVLTLGFTALGYFVVYLITPYDIYWHLRFSLNRLLLQLWPSVIFVVFRKVRLEISGCASD